MKHSWKQHQKALCPSTYKNNESILLVLNYVYHTVGIGWWISVFYPVYIYAQLKTFILPKLKFFDYGKYCPMVDWTPPHPTPYMLPPHW